MKINYPIIDTECSIEHEGIKKIVADCLNKLKQELVRLDNTKEPIIITLDSYKETK